jgi:hypothetical protein
MGRKHIGTLKEFTLVKSQERVWKDIVPMESETTADARSTDAKMLKPHIRKTYAQVVRKQPKQGRV